MKISLNWLEDWVDLSGIEVDELAHRLTMAGLEVDAVEEFGRDTGEIRVGRIESIDPHPDADRLVLCEVDVGDGSSRQIACGADNMDAGDLVPAALPGSRPPSVDFEVTERDLMGQRSEGMLCSAAELGLDEESEGLWILDSDLEVGADVFETLQLSDTRLTFDLTPNRSDCLSHLGVAREVGAIWERPIEPRPFADGSPVWERPEADVAAGDVADLTVEDSEGAPRYAFGVMTSVEVGPSPIWLKRRLAAVGVRSVNNVVDVTNYVLMDVGQPLHAFDLDELEGPEIRVRRARDGEELEAIDHETYHLDEDDLVIADAERPVALAGVMGGADTEVGASTDRILLECAFFDPRVVRRSSKRHDLHTESSHRFERRIDPAGLRPYMDHALRALGRAQPDEAGHVARGIEERSVDGIDDTWRVDLPKEMPRELLGETGAPEDAAALLERLDLEVADEGEVWRTEIPTYRGDLTRPADLVEEVARLYGYDTVEPTLPHREMGGDHTARTDREHAPTIRSRRLRAVRRRARDRLLDRGLYEVLTPSFMSADALDDLGVPDDDKRRNLVEVANPLRASERYLRTTLLPGLIDVLETNRAHKRRDVAIFEFGQRYFPEAERPSLAMLLAGTAVRHWSDDRSWDFFDLKGMVESVGAAFDLRETTWREPERDRPWLHPGVSAVWTEGDDVLAEGGRLHPELVQSLELEGPILVAEVWWDRLVASALEEPNYESFSSQPPVDRDIAIVLDQDISYRAVADAIESYREKRPDFDDLVESVELFDVYQGDQIGDDERSLALSVRFRAPDRTLTEDEVEPLDSGLVDWLDEQLGARRR